MQMHCRIFHHFVSLYILSQTNVFLGFQNKKGEVTGNIYKY
jgi:hypothetical protein